MLAYCSDHYRPSDGIACSCCMRGGIRLYLTAVCVPLCSVWQSCLLEVENRSLFGLVCRVSGCDAVFIGLVCSSLARSVWWAAAGGRDGGLSVGRRLASVA